MNHKNQEDKDNQEETTIQRKSWQDGGGDTGGNDNSSPNNNDGFTDNSQSAKDALQLQKMAEASSEYIQLKSGPIILAVVVMLPLTIIRYRKKKIKPACLIS